jgi:conjugal transfer mating pair stabilization protein TraG
MLQSAYEFARHAVESAQLTEANSLIKDFRSSEAYQWGRSNRTTSTAGYDSASREASERQSSSVNAYNTARELARTAQFMRGWASGTQTDFTNYAVQRLAERGLLREEDPIKLQRAVTEIAYSYARGGDTATGFVPRNDPLLPSRELTDALGWPGTSLREEYDAAARIADSSVLREQAARNEAEIRNRQTRERALPDQAVGNDLAHRIDADESIGKDHVEKGRQQVAREVGTLSENYRATVRIDKISRHHGGNQAVWDTVGANASQPDLGDPPKTDPIGEWYLGKDGVPRLGSDPRENGEPLGPVKSDNRPQRDQNNSKR